MKPGYEKRFNNGDIVFWCHCLGNGKYEVRWGMVDEQFSDAVCIDYLSPRERRLIDGISFDEFKDEQHYRKLPKGWTYNTELFKLEWEEMPDDEKNFIINFHNPETIKEAYEKGYFVKSRKIYHGDVEAEITKQGFRLVKKYPMWDHKIDYVSVRPDKVYFTYNEAKKEVDDEVAEFQRQASLSDYDWAVEQIDKDLERYKNLYGISEDVIKQYRDWLLSMKNVEDIETRLSGGGIQWKYWKNKKWMNIEL